MPEQASNVWGGVDSQPSRRRPFSKSGIDSIHAAVILWLGGGISHIILGTTAAASGRNDDLLAIVKAVALSHKLLRFATADSVGLAAIVYFMVMKPGWQDTAMWLVPLVIAAALAAYFLMRPMKAFTA